jgi:hypothetical protein
MAGKPIDYADLIKQNEGQVESFVKSLISRETEGCVSALAGVLAGVATGTPTLGALAAHTVQRAFATTATRRLIAEYELAQEEEDREKFIATIADAIEALLGQMLVQLIRVEHNVKDELLNTLGGIRADLQDFRLSIEAQLGPAEKAALVQAVKASPNVSVSARGRARSFLAAGANDPTTASTEAPTTVITHIHQTSGTIVSAPHLHGDIVFGNKYENKK